MNGRPDEYRMRCSVCHKGVKLLVNPGETRASALEKLSRQPGWTVIDGEVICSDSHDREGISLRGVFWGLGISMILWGLIMLTAWAVLQWL
jgi:hypothetical protein